MLINIAIIQAELGEADQAIQTFKRPIVTAEKGLGPNHPLSERHWPAKPHCRANYTQTGGRSLRRRSPM